MPELSVVVTFKEQGNWATMERGRKERDDEPPPPESEEGKVVPMLVVLPLPASE